MAKAFEYFEDEKNQQIIDGTLEQCEKYCESRRTIHIYPGGKDRDLNVHYEKVVR